MGAELAARASSHGRTIAYISQVATVQQAARYGGLAVVAGGSVSMTVEHQAWLGSG